VGDNQSTEPARDERPARTIYAVAMHDHLGLLITVTSAVYVVLRIAIASHFSYEVAATIVREQGTAGVFLGTLAASPILVAAVLTLLGFSGFVYQLRQGASTFWSLFVLVVALYRIRGRRTLVGLLDFR
jgi:hypothetical protein